MSTPIAPVGGNPTGAGLAELRKGEPERTPRAERSRETDGRSASGSPEAQAASALENSIQQAIGDRSIEFSYDDSTNRVVVKVRSRESGEVVRQIPPEHFLAFSSKFREMLGVLFDEVI